MPLWKIYTTDFGLKS